VPAPFDYIFLLAFLHFFLASAYTVCIGIPVIWSGLLFTENDMHKLASILFATVFACSGTAVFAADTTGSSGSVSGSTATDADVGVTSGSSSTGIDANADTSTSLETGSVGLDNETNAGVDTSGGNTGVKGNSSTSTNTR
jgi:hypothetical protein